MVNGETETDTAERTRFEPGESEAGAPLWQATREQRLVLPWCGICERPHWYPREVCPYCLAADIEWRDASGDGVVYAASVQHRAAWPTLADRVPYTVALVDLDEGVRVMSNLIGIAPDDAMIGQQVRVTWEPLSDGRYLPQFEPRP